MEDLGLSLLVIAITGLGVIGIFIIVNQRKKAVEKSLLELCSKKGWAFEPVKEPLKWGYRLVSARWTLEALSVASGHSVEPSQNDVSQKTIICAPKLSIPGLLLIQPLDRTSQPLNPMQQKLVGLAARSFSGGFYSDLQEISVVSADFRSQYLTMGQMGDFTSKVFSPKVESILMNWKGARPWLKIDNAGMLVEIRDKHIKNIEEIIRLVDLADAFASAFDNKK